MINEKKVDLRIQKTKTSIKETFIELVEQKGFNHVSVSQITSKANINRNTFYLHYTDIEDLAKKIIDEASHNLIEGMTENNMSENKFDLFYKNKIEEVEIRWGFRHILKWLEPEVELYRIYLLDEHLKGYISNLSDTIKHSLAKMLCIKNTRSNLIFEYTFSGMFGIITQWIMFSPASIGETSRVLARLSYYSLYQLNTL